MPYAPPPPKSGCSSVLPLPLMFATYCDEFARSGYTDTSVFHGLLPGNTWQPPTEGAPVDCGPGDGATHAVAPSASASTSATAGTSGAGLRIGIPLHPCDRRVAGRH